MGAFFFLSPDEATVCNRRRKNDEGRWDCEGGFSCPDAFRIYAVPFIVMGINLKITGFFYNAGQNNHCLQFNPGQT